MSRRKQLGDLGERWTTQLLENAGFTSVKDLNAIRYNHPGGDFLAVRGRQLYFITVKARNKYQQRTRRLNGGYNIYPERVRRAAEQYKDTIPAWLTIQLDTDSRCYSAYFGTIASLRNPLAVAVPMTPLAIAGYECLAHEKFDPAITSELSNQLTDQNQPHIPPTEPRIATNDPLSKRHVRARPQSSTFVSFQDHVAYADPPIRPLVQQLRTRIIGLHRSERAITERITKHQRIAYSVERVFAEVKVQKKRVLVRFFGTGVADPKNLITDVPATHQWQHDKEIALDSPNLIDYAMRFIEPSYRSHRAT